MKKVILILIIFSLIFISFFVFKKEEEKQKNNSISIILETEEGNLKSEKFPDKQSYVFDKITCKNSKNNVVPTFDKNDWKLKINIEEEKIDGNFICDIYFKKQTYNVEVIVKNGTIVGETSKSITHGNSATFTVNPSSGYGNPTVTCTNSQKGSISGNIATVSNVTNNTTCTVTYNPFATTTIIANALPHESHNIGLIKIEQDATDQTPALTEYRYSGKTVNNYIEFNNETWRIIGVFKVDDGTGKYENRLKLVREDSIGLYSWDTSSSSVNSGYGISQWGESGTYEGADLMRLLNPGYTGINGSLYYNSSSGTCYVYNNNATSSCNFSNTGLKNDAKEMIDTVKWYTAITINGTTAHESYMAEREDITRTETDGVTRLPYWVGKVALIYPSDYGYSSSGCRNGEQMINYYEKEPCYNTSWLYDSSVYVTLTPVGNWLIRTIGIGGPVLGGYCSGTSTQRVNVRPTVYLKPEVIITSGNGSVNNPYEISL